MPYKYKDLELIYENSNGKYNSIMEIIHDLYIIPLSRFNHPAFSRFRETYKFVRTKCNKKSFIKALDLSLELMFKYDLNPIIIAACRNMDELDIYLDCLAEKELYDYKCFEIRYDFN